MNDQSFSLSRTGAMPAHQTVSASELVRQFGLWQDLAAREPVYILHRGRARLVLASVEIMSALCAPHTGDRPHFEAREAVLLDTMTETAAIVDPDLNIVAIGRAARVYFGERAVVGAALGYILPHAIADFVTDTVRRTMASGIAEQIELIDGTPRGRRLEVAIVPHPAGALLVGRDRSVEDARDDAQAHARAAAAALATLPGLATAQIGLRGYLSHGDASLTRLTGVAAEALTSVRFVTLFEVGSRVPVGDAIEATLADGIARAVDARLLVAGSATVPAQIALAALFRGGVVTGLLAVIAAGQG